MVYNALKGTPGLILENNVQMLESGVMASQITVYVNDKESNTSLTKEERVWLSIYRASLNKESSPDCAKFNATQAVEDFRKAFPV